MTKQHDYLDKGSFFKKEKKKHLQTKPSYIRFAFKPFERIKCRRQRKLSGNLNRGEKEKKRKRTKTNTKESRGVNNFKNEHNIA